MHVFGLMMLSLSSKYYQIILSQSICSGLGLSLFFTPSLSAVSCTNFFTLETTSDRFSPKLGLQRDAPWHSDFVCLAQL